MESENLHCGNDKKPKDGESLEDVINQSFARMEKLQAKDFLKRLDRMSSVLDGLENEINAIISAKK